MTASPHSEEWRQERNRMRIFIVKQTIKKITQEDLIRIATQVIHERYFFAADNVLIAKYESLSGEYKKEQ